jgi:hypothetical protein
MPTNGPGAKARCPPDRMTTSPRRACRPLRDRSNCRPCLVHRRGPRVEPAGPAGTTQSTVSS